MSEIEKLVNGGLWIRCEICDDMSILTRDDDVLLSYGSRLYLWEIRIGKRVDC